jgi:hypothetical protein
MAEGFIEKIVFEYEWTSGGEQFRLIDVGAGPMRLQVLKDGEWVKESEHYEWGVLTHRIKSLAAITNNFIQFYH